MGYEVHITRAADWTDSASKPITIDEWTHFVRSDPEMRLDGFAEVANPQGEVLRYENPGLAVWTRYTVQSAGPAYFDFRDGRIVVKAPDDEILEKMKQIAICLNANVIGDEGEVYAGPAQTEQNRPREQASKLEKLDWFAIAIPTTWGTLFTIAGLWIIAKGLWYAMQGIAPTNAIVVGSAISLTFLFLGYRGIRNVIAILKRQPEAKAQVIVIAVLSVVLLYLKIAWK